MLRPAKIFTLRKCYAVQIFILQFIFCQNQLLPAPQNKNHTPVNNVFKKQEIPGFYPGLNAIYQQMDSLQQRYPDLIKKEEIGVSSTKAQPIYAFKLSDIVAEDEDESAILFSSLHHAREAVGAMFLVHFLKEMVTKYDDDPRMQYLVDNLAIWIVPVVNPDGYEYMFEKTPCFPWWRKNIRNYYTHKRNMGLGVDLNRNYNFNWKQGGDASPSSWYYRGQSPASESEVQTMQNLAKRENVIAGATFHSYGELILFPWGNYYTSPEQDLLYKFASNIAGLLEKTDGTDTYDIGMLDGLAGQSSNWMHGKLHAMDFTFELGTSYFPDRKEVNKVLHQTMKSVMFFLNDVLHTGIRGHVVDYLTGKPVIARVLVEGHEASFVAERQSEGTYGRFERLLLPGIYNLLVLADGYSPQYMADIEVREDEITSLTIFLMREERSQRDATH